MLELAFLINPVSGGGVGKSVFHQLGEVLDSFGIDRQTWTAELTESDRIAEQTDALLQSARKLIAVGGDGTLGAVLDRVRRLQPSTVIGLIPLGTGNDLGRELGIYRVYSSKGLIACLKRLLRAQSRSFDLWDVSGETTLVSYLSIGMDAAVLRCFDQARKQGRIRGGALGNKLFYVYAFFRNTFTRLPAGTVARLETREGLREIPLAKARALLVANINSYAAGAHPFPENRFDDGYLEVAVFEQLWKYALVTAGSRLIPALAGCLRRGAARLQAHRVTLILAPETPLQVDGEDLTHRFEKGGECRISLAARVEMLDLRRSFYTLF